MKELQTLDYVVVILYFVGIAWISIWFGRRTKTTSRYFVADRSIPTWAVAFTLMATMISAGTIVGHPGTVFRDGMILLLGSSTLPIVLIFVAIYIVPFYRNVVRLSAYEYLGKRFGFFSRLYASLGFVIDRVFDLGVSLVATAVALKVMTNWDMHSVIIGLGAFTILYTAVGGIEAVVWTNAVQGVILLGSGFLVLAFLLLTPEAGAPGAALVEGWKGGRFYLGSFELSWESLFNRETTTQWLFIIAYMTNWGRRYITDQHMVQRYLLARSDREAKAGAFWGASSCAPIWALFMLIGACLYGYYELTPHEPRGLADEMVPYFLVNTFPMGVVGLILAAIMAASMSSISADLNSVATVLTTDYFGKAVPRASDKTRLLFGRLMVCVAGVFATGVAILMIPEEGIATLMERVVTILAILSGGVLGLFALGFLTRTGTRRGCYTGIVACLLFTFWGVVTNVDSTVQEARDLVPEVAEAIGPELAVALLESPLEDEADINGQKQRVAALREKLAAVEGPQARRLMEVSDGLLEKGGVMDLGFNFTMNPIFIGIFGHLVLFVVGYLTSLFFGGYRPEASELKRLTIYGRKDIVAT